jgi:Ran GTPase-activating protein (RanGAP) involved in mRNA processing and transport
VRITGNFASSISYQQLHNKALEQAGETRSFKALQNDTGGKKKEAASKLDSVTISQEALLAYQKSISNT